MLLNRVLTVSLGSPLRIGERLGGGDRMRYPGTGGARAADGGNPVGPRRIDAEADAHGRSVRVIESPHPSPLSASRGFRFTTVQQVKRIA